MPDWWSWNPLDWLNAILTVPFCGLMFIVLALVFGVIAKLVAEWMDRRTLRSNSKPIKVVKYEPPQAIGTAFEGFPVPQWHTHSKAVELALLVALREQARITGRRAEKKEQEV